MKINQRRLAWTLALAVSVGTGGLTHASTYQDRDSDRHEDQDRHDDHDRDWHRDHDRDRNDNDYRNRNGGYNGGSYNNGRGGNQAAQIGFEDGRLDGQNDRRTGHSFRPTHDDNYKNASRGYNSSWGDKNQYKQMYRQGYARGYPQGYNGRG